MFTQDKALNTLIYGLRGRLHDGFVGSTGSTKPRKLWAGRRMYLKSFNFIRIYPIWTYRYHFDTGNCITFVTCLCILEMNKLLYRADSCRLRF